MRVLLVCTANICRSASAHRLLVVGAAAPPALPLEVRSAGTHALAGQPGCALAPALASNPDSHRSQPLTPDLVRWADLLLPAARDHRSAIAAADPAARRRTFTLRQAGRIAQWMLAAGIVEAGARKSMDAAADYAEDDPRAAVGPLPADLGQRWEWLVEEMDSARLFGAAARDPGQSPEQVPDERPRGLTRWRLRRGTAVAQDEPPHPDDVPDPHILGAHLHERAYTQIREATDSLLTLMRQVAHA